MIGTVKAPHIYLPRSGVDMSKYAVIACDQYTSNLEYWNSLKEEVGNSVSTFHISLNKVRKKECSQEIMC